MYINNTNVESPGQVASSTSCSLIHLLVHFFEILDFHLLTFINMQFLLEPIVLALLWRNHFHFLVLVFLVFIFKFTSFRAPWERLVVGDHDLLGVHGDVWDVLNALESIAFANLLGSLLAVRIDVGSLVPLVGGLAELVLVSVLEALKVLSSYVRGWLGEPVLFLIGLRFFFHVAALFWAASFLRSRALASRFVTYWYIQHEPRCLDSWLLFDFLWRLFVQCRLQEFFQLSEMQALEVIVRHCSLNFLEDLELWRVGQIARLCLKDPLDGVLLLLVNVGGDVAILLKLTQKVAEYCLWAQLETTSGLSLLEYDPDNFLQQCLVVLAAALWWLVPVQDLMLGC
jgi:hypothetical protein